MTHAFAVTQDIAALMPTLPNGLENLPDLVMKAAKALRLSHTLTLENSVMKNLKAKGVGKKTVFRKIKDTFSEAMTPLTAFLPDGETVEAKVFPSIWAEVTEKQSEKKST